MKKLFDFSDNNGLEVNAFCYDSVACLYRRIGGGTDSYRIDTCVDVQTVYSERDYTVSKDEIIFLQATRRLDALKNDPKGKILTDSFHQLQSFRSAQYNK